MRTKCLRVTRTISVTVSICPLLRAELPFDENRIHDGVTERFLNTYRGWPRVSEKFLIVLLEVRAWRCGCAEIVEKDVQYPLHSR